MTAEEWDRCTEPDSMLSFLRGKAQARKLGLFACAVCRRVWHLLRDGRSRQAVDLAERLADGCMDAADLDAALSGAEAAVLETGRGPSGEPARSRESALLGSPFPELAFAAEAALCVLNYRERDAAEAVLVYAHYAATRRAGEVNQPEHAALLRDLFGNPFRRVAVDPTWLAWHGGAIKGLAQAVYDERELPSGHLEAARLAVLADMLEEAACSDAEILGHLRGPGPHVRGCWPIDALLGRS